MKPELSKDRIKLIRNKIKQKLKNHNLIIASIKYVSGKSMGMYHFHNYFSFNIIQSKPLYFMCGNFFGFTYDVGFSSDKNFEMTIEKELDFLCDNIKKKVYKESHSKKWKEYIKNRKINIKLLLDKL